MNHYLVMSSPVGPLTLTGDGDHLTGLRFGAPRPEDVDALGAETPEAFTDTLGQLAEYFDGKRTEFELPLAPTGTPFQRQVWDGLCRISHGDTASYAGLAERIGKPSAVRAVGMANNRNPIAIIVPCHRVIGADGSLVGFAGGLRIKRQLLEHEGHAFDPSGRVAVGVRSGVQESMF